MNPVDRRSVMQWAGAMALAAMGGTRAMAVRSPAMRFAPPAVPMRYSRTLVRTMAGGYSLTVERSFAVRFEEAARGFAIQGRQTGVEVDAPTTLAALAALERKRVETGLFPLHLDASGLIADSPHPAGLANIDEVLAATRAVIAQRALSSGERAEAAQFLSLVHQSASSFLSHLPADLFAPAEPHRVEQRAIELPGEGGAGETGTVRVEFVASADPQTGLMRTARREIVTEIAGERRVTREDWSLAPL